MTQAFKRPPERRQQLALLGRWSGIAILFFGSIWLVTRQEAAPQLILLWLLTLITYSFSLSAEEGGVGLVPLVGATTLLLTGLPTALLVVGAGLIVAELARPLAAPLRAPEGGAEPASWRLRLATLAIHLAALTVAGLVYGRLGGRPRLPVLGATALIGFSGLAAGYAITHLGLTALLWLATRRPGRRFVTDVAPQIVAGSLLALPFALLGPAILATGGMPFFVVYCLGVMVVTIVLWLSWQRQTALRQQLLQFGEVNEVGIWLRETLALPEVLQRSRQALASLVPATRIHIWLRTADEAWQVTAGDDPAGGRPATPDDLVNWVARRRQPLHLHTGNMHFAAHHDVTLPSPPPAAWLGVPLLAQDDLLGVLALQRARPGGPFSRWSRELLLSVAAQVSIAIQNARLFGDTVRLYNLADAALAERLEQLQALLNAVQEGVIMVDQQATILFLNPVAAGWLGVPGGDARGQSLDTERAVAWLGYDPAAWQRRQAALAAGDLPAGTADPEPVTYRLPAGDARARLLERQETAVRDRDGQVMGWLLVLRDVTEAHALAERRADLTRMIVHDLRNPLTTLTSTIRAIEGHLTAAPPSLLDLLADARHGTADMTDMVDSLMDVNRLEAGRWQPDAEAMRLPALAQRVVRRLQPLAAQRQVDLQLHVADPLPPVWADADMIRRVLINLLDNGLKYTPARGRVTLTLQPEPPVAGHEAGVRCLVADTGPGIPPEQRDWVFERFMRTNPGGGQIQGTGLGLTYCRIAVEAHGGRIWVQPGSAGGSTFTFTLPGIPLFVHEEHEEPV